MTAIPLQPCRERSAAPGRRVALDALDDATQAVLATVREWRRRSLGRRQLAGLDERTLADIGLTRSDAEFLANKPFWRK